jgi:cell wall-associated NlpC family hydrolase
VSVEDFLNTFQNTLLNKKTVNPLSNGPVVRSSTPKFGTSTTAINPLSSQNTQSWGATIPGWLNSRKSNALNTYVQNKGVQTSQLAQRFNQDAAGKVPTDQFGVVQLPPSNFNDSLNQQLTTIDQTGKNALQASESAAQFQQLQQQAQMAAGVQVNMMPGSTSGNPGAQAVAMAMTAYQNGTPYVWGGNSLTKGVDCSGLVQQIYKNLGINLPRTTYEQAKAGKKVSLNSLLPGDLVFYNTGSSDPNGIGSLSHVAIYIGNGQVISALNTKSGIKIQPINNNGGAVEAIQPW